MSHRLCEMSSTFKYLGFTLNPVHKRLRQLHRPVNWHGPFAAAEHECFLQHITTGFRRVVVVGSLHSQLTGSSCTVRVGSLSPVSNSHTSPRSTVHTPCGTVDGNSENTTGHGGIEGHLTFPVSKKYFFPFLRNTVSRLNTVTSFQEMLFPVSTKYCFPFHEILALR